jgi:hypothetical protein
VLSAAASKGPEYVTLTDGRLYDNLGVNATLYEATNVDYVTRT